MTSVIAMHERWEEIVGGIFGYALVAAFIFGVVVFVRLYLRSRRLRRGPPPSI
jgi:hypothetical protein